MLIRFPVLLARMLSLTIFTSILIGQTGCARTPQSSQPAPGPATQPAASLNPPAEQGDKPQPGAAEIQAEHAVITFSAYESERSMYEPLMAQFHEENPTITVKFTPLPSSPSGSAVDYFRTLASSADTLLISGSPAEAQPYFRDLQSQIDMDADFHPDEFWPDAVSACQDAQGRVLGVP